MKCVCGYEYRKRDDRLESWIAREERLAAGDVPFVPITTQILIPVSEMRGSMIEADLHICPKCGTVRAERW